METISPTGVQMELWKASLEQLLRIQFGDQEILLLILYPNQVNWFLNQNKEWKEDLHSNSSYSGPVSRLVVLRDSEAIYIQILKQPIIA